MKEKVGKPGFFAALWGVCCGTSVFPQLVNNTRSRTLWHLFLMSLLCAVLLSLRMFPLLRSEWKNVAKRYVEVFGTQIEFSDAGIIPEGENRSRNMPLPNSGCLVYTAAREKEITLPEDLSSANYLVVWNGNFIAFAFTGDHRHWDILLSRPHRSNERRRVDRENLAKYFNDELTRRGTLDGVGGYRGFMTVDIDRVVEGLLGAIDREECKEHKETLRQALMLIHNAY